MPNLAQTQLALITLLLFINVNAFWLLANIFCLKNRDTLALAKTHLASKAICQFNEAFIPLSPSLYTSQKMHVNKPRNK